MENSILYLCDKKACDKCVSPMCRHTTNIEHAKNFVKGLDGYFERETPEASGTPIEPPRDVVIIKSEGILSLEVIRERVKLYGEMIREHGVIILAPGDKLVGVEHLSRDSLIEMSE